MNAVASRYQAAQKTLRDEEGRTHAGHFNDAAQGSRRAVVVVHDFFGLTPRVRSLTTRLAADGFVAFAPDLYRGVVANSREEATELAKQLAWNRVATELGLVIGVLKRSRPGMRVGILGFAMGGAAALVAAAAVPLLDAAVSYYGIPQDVVIDSPTIRVQGHFANRDAKCSPERVSVFAAGLAARGVTHEVHCYEADNGFADITRTDAYVESAARLAWGRSTAFLVEALG